MTNFHAHFWCPFCEAVTTAPMAAAEGNAICSICGRVSWDNRGAPIERYCRRCNAMVEVDRDKEKDECTRCHLVFSHVEFHGNDLTGYTQQLYPTFPFDPGDEAFSICSNREFSQAAGYWCEKFNRPCIGSCLWKRERMKVRRQAEMSEWFT